MLDLAGVDHFDIVEKLSEDSYILTQVGEKPPSSLHSEHSQDGTAWGAVLRGVLPAYGCAAAASGLQEQKSGARHCSQGSTPHLR